MCRRQGFMTQHMQKKFITKTYSQEIIDKVNESLKEIVPKIATSTTNDLIYDNLPRLVSDANMVLNVHPTTIVDPKLWTALKATNNSTTTTFFKRDHDDHQGNDANPEGEKGAKKQSQQQDLDAWDDIPIIDKDKVILKEETPELIDEFQNVDKRSQQQDLDAWVDIPIIDKEVISKEETPELIDEFQNVDKRVPTIYDHERMKATIRDILSNQFRDVEEYAYHLEQAQKFIENEVVWESIQEDLKCPQPDALNLYGPLNEASRTFNEESRLSIQHWKDSWHKRMYKIKHKKVRDNPEEVFSNHMIVEIVKVTTKQQYGHDFIERITVMRENDELDSFSKADFKYLNKNDIEDMYYLYLNNKNYHENKLLNSLLTFIRSCVIWKRVHDLQLGIESYQIKINLTAPTLTFPRIKACKPYSIINKPIVSLIYLNNKEEKWIMDLVNIAKFYDATLEKVLKEVKLNIFKTEFRMKTLLLEN
ncbi:hypothetical protein Tco_0417691 [Tanacetum coccineum]